MSKAPKVRISHTALDVGTLLDSRVSSSSCLPMAGMILLSLDKGISGLASSAIQD